MKVLKNLIDYNCFLKPTRAQSEGGGRWGRMPPPAFHPFAKDMYLIEAQQILQLD